MWLVFGFVLTDIINEFKLFTQSMPLYAVMGPVMLFFGLQEAFLKRLEIKRKSSTDPGFDDSRMVKIIYVLIWIFAICLLLSIPLVWWGVIMKATKASDTWNWQVPLPK